MAEKQDDQGATPPAQSLSVVIPPRTQPRQAEFLRRAVQSIKAQTIYSKTTVDIIVSVDRAQLFPAGLADEPGLVAVESHAASQAAALNAAIRNVNTDLIAVLEDDDRWRPRSLELARWALSQAGFASSTRLELNEKNEVVRIKNFPTPSGWLMPVSTMRTVGEFNEGYRWHLDNEWLGRLAESKIPHIHLVEATAPIELRHMAGNRPWLANVIKFGGEAIRIARHDVPLPLIQRLVHPQSGASKIQHDSEMRNEAQKEVKKLVARFGFIPW
jgi:glycosyltransferase involved in cell wall biosynthesis